MKELEPKISEVELTMNHEKSPLTALGLKEAKIYLVKIMSDRFKTKNFVDCFPAYSKRQVCVVRLCH